MRVCLCKKEKKKKKKKKKKKVLRTIIKKTGLKQYLKLRTRNAFRVTKIKKPWNSIVLKDVRNLLFFFLLEFYRESTEHVVGYVKKKTNLGSHTHHRLTDN